MYTEEKYKEEIASILGCSPDSIFLYWKGRVALYAALKAMGIKAGDEIILPAFTCVVVPNAIIYAEAIPVYVDISVENYNLDLTKLNGAISSNTKAILCQNTFGLSSNVEDIVNIAAKKNLYTIEDCTHGFGGFYNGKSNGSYCDAAFYSTQWNKPFSTGIGGFLVVNNPVLLEKVRSLEKDKIKPGFKETHLLSSLIFFRKYFINNFTQPVLVKLFRLLSMYNLIPGSNQGNELRAPELPEDYFKDISPVQIKTGLKNLRGINELNTLRKNNAKDYTKFLKGHNKTYVKEQLFDNHIFLKYPLLVTDRKLFFTRAKDSGIILGDWFLSPLHPIETDLHLWGFSEDLYPNAVSISEKIVNIPTDVKNNQKVLGFLKNFLEMIE